MPPLGARAQALTARTLPPLSIWPCGPPGGWVDTRGLRPPSVRPNHLAGGRVVTAKHKTTLKLLRLKTRLMDTANMNLRNCNHSLQAYFCAFHCTGFQATECEHSKAEVRESEPNTRPPFCHLLHTFRVSSLRYPVCSCQQTSSMYRLFLQF